ncbi:MAG: hypothetical protein MK095_10565, partial [Phycisphaerales bacterium]|nr:hypothetical protein [Phycisphaerales bacterium]
MKQQETTLKSLISAAAIALMATSASADRVQWPASEGGNGHEYEVVLTPGGMNWTDAKAAAEQAGGHLATVSDMAELDFINSLNFSGTSKGWIGGYQDTSASDYEEPYGGWRWVTDEPWSFVGWWDGAPSSSPTRNFVQLAYTQCQDEIDVDNEGEWYVVEYEVASSALQWASNGHWYEFVPVDQNWDLHNAEALARGAHLVTITSAAEGQFVEYVRDLNDSQAAFHTGGYQDPAAPDYSEPAGGWRWVTGEPFNYTNWGYSDGAYQPNN